MCTDDSAIMAREHYFIEDHEIDVVYLNMPKVGEHLNDVLVDYDTDLFKPKLVVALEGGVALLGKSQIEVWQGRVAGFPQEPSTAMARKSFPFYAV